MKLWFVNVGEAVSLVLDLVIERIVAYKQLWLYAYYNIFMLVLIMLEENEKDNFSKMRNLQY